MIRVPSSLSAPTLGLMVACGSTEGPAGAPPSSANADAGGANPGADGSVYDFDGRGAGFSVAIEDSAHVALKSVTLNCAGDCVDVQAVADGGVQPYTYVWSDGASGPTRHLCPNSTATFTVSVTDAGVTGGEFARPPRTTQASLTVEAPSCAQAGPSGPEAGDAIATSDGSSSDGSPKSGSGCGAGSGSASSSSPPSCAPSGPGMTDCGANSESCCTSLGVPGGSYYRTYANSGSGPTGEADPATVSCFLLDKYEVTVGRFRQFVKAWNGGWLPPAGSGKHTHLNGGRGLINVGGDAGLLYETGWVASDDGDVAPTDGNLTCDPGSNDPSANIGTWTPSAGTNENRPVNCELWVEAYAFCIWDGGFLPSEAEWEYAAAGGSQHRQYPWGTASPGTANQYAIYGCYYPSGSASCASTAIANIAPVGTATLGEGRWGHLDLLGNVWEWNLDWSANYVDPCVDCANGTASPARVIRGSDYGNPLSYLSSPARDSDFPPSRAAGDGFRCARAP
jgi:sulfatase modifying factor 1